MAFTLVGVEQLIEKLERARQNAPVIAQRACLELAQTIYEESQELVPVGPSNAKGISEGDLKASGKVVAGFEDRETPTGRLGGKVVGATIIYDAPHAAWVHEGHDVYNQYGGPFGHVAAREFLATPYWAHAGELEQQLANGFSVQAWIE